MHLSTLFPEGVAVEVADWTISVKVEVHSRVVEYVAYAVDIIFFFLVVENHLQGRLIVGHSLDGEGAIDPHKLSRDDYVVCDGEGNDGVVVDQMLLPDDQVSAAAIVDESFALRPFEKIGLEPLMLVVVQDYTLVIVEGVELPGHRVLSVVGDKFFGPDRQHFLASLNLVVKIQTAGRWEFGAFG